MTQSVDLQAFLAQVHHGNIRPRNGSPGRVGAQRLVFEQAIPCRFVWIVADRGIGYYCKLYLSLQRHTAWAFCWSNRLLNLLQILVQDRDTVILADNDWGYWGSCAFVTAPVP